MLPRKWYWTLILLLPLGIGSFVLLLSKTPPDPVKIYKTVTPAPKTKQPSAPGPKKTDLPSTTGMNNNYDHLHNTAPHSHIVKPATLEDEYDWRADDDMFDSSMPNTDPWKSFEAPDTEIKTINGDEENDPPQDWHMTKDPDLYTRYFRAQLVKQFGDIPEVHILADTTLKIRKNMPLTRDEYIADLEAQYALWPDERTLQALEAAKSEDRRSTILFSED